MDTELTYFLHNNAVYVTVQKCNIKRNIGMKDLVNRFNMKAVFVYYILLQRGNLMKEFPL